MREYLTHDGRAYFWRRRGSGDDWKPYEQEDSRQPAEQAAATRLMLVRHNQGEGEPKHWALFIAKENEKGMVLQVTGDATNMRYAHETDAGVLNSNTVHSCYVLCHTLSQTDLAHFHNAVNEAPPSAPTRRDVKENCQGWTFRVVSRLVEAGVVSHD